jgi:F-box protein 11
VQGALDYVDERGAAGAGSSDGSNGHSALVFLHAGTYRGEFLVIDSNVALIGAAPGNVAESVILERESESTVMFVEGAKHAYAGHLTLKFSPDVTSTVPHHKHYCLEVGENCSPTVDHCIIRSTSVGEYHKHVRYDELMLNIHSSVLHQVRMSLKIILLLSQ